MKIAVMIHSAAIPKEEITEFLGDYISKRYNCQKALSVSVVTTSVVYHGAKTTEVATTEPLHHALPFAKPASLSPFRLWLAQGSYLTQDLHDG
jgi:hypothetical protein